MHPLLEMYLPLVDFLSEALGKHTEVALHDLTSLNHSLVAIKNNHISGREIGAPVTDMTLQILNQADTSHIPYLTNYSGKAFNGTTLHSSTFFIRDKQETIGMLCLNSDYSNLKSASEMLSEFMNSLHLSNSISVISETFNTDVEALIQSNISSAYPAYQDNENKRGLSHKQKSEITARLNDMGTFLLKGSVPITAKAIGVSIPTMYRYISEAKKKKEE